MSTVLAVPECGFHHNSMRPRRNFDIVDSLDRAHLELQNKPLVVCFTGWVQMFLRCETEELAKRRRNNWDPDQSAEILQSYQI